MNEQPWFIKDSHFRELMEGDAMAQFMRICPEKQFERGAHVFRQGDPATHLHVIASGQVKLVVPTATGHERLIAVIGPEGMIGEAFVVGLQEYRVDAVALTAVETCPMDRSQLAQLALQAPDFVLQFCSILATSLLGCREALGRSFDPVKIRVAKVLLDQARQFGQPDPADPSQVTLHTELRHEDIASLASATRVSASTAIAELRDLGWVDGSRGMYRVDVAGLGLFVDEID